MTLVLSHVFVQAWGRRLIAAGQPSINVICPGITSLGAGSSTDPQAGH